MDGLEKEIIKLLKIKKENILEEKLSHITLRKTK